MTYSSTEKPHLAPYPRAILLVSQVRPSQPPHQLPHLLTPERHLPQLLHLPPQDILQNPPRRLRIRLPTHIHIHRLLLQVLLPPYQDKIIPQPLRIRDLLRQRAPSDIVIDEEDRFIQRPRSDHGTVSVVASGRATRKTTRQSLRLIAHRIGQIRNLAARGKDDGLPRTEPEGPMAPVVLDQQGHEALQRAEDGAVDDDGRYESGSRFRGVVSATEDTSTDSLKGRRRRHVFQLEELRQLEVELDGGGLVFFPVRVGEYDIDLRPVEGAVARIERPRLAAAVEGMRQLCFSAVPFGDGADVVVRRSRRQDELVRSQFERIVDHGDELEGSGNLLGDLAPAAEDVPVVLVEAAHSRQAAQGARDLVAVQRAEVGVADRQVFVGPPLRFEQQAVAWTIHRLQAVFLVLANLGVFLLFARRAPPVHLEHVIFVVGPVAGFLPERALVDGRREDFLEAEERVLGAEEGEEFVEDAGAVGEEEGRAGAVEGGREEFLFGAEGAVVGWWSGWGFGRGV